MRKMSLVILLAFVLGVSGVYAFKHDLIHFPGQAVAQAGEPNQGASSGPEGRHRRHHNVPPECQQIMQNAKQQIEPLRQQIEQIMQNAKAQCQQAVQQQKGQSGGSGTGQ